MCRQDSLGIASIWLLEDVSSSTCKDEVLEILVSDIIDKRYISMANCWVELISKRYWGKNGMSDSTWDRVGLDWLMQSRMTLILMGKTVGLELFLHWGSRNWSLKYLRVNFLIFVYSIIQHWLRLRRTSTQLLERNGLARRYLWRRRRVRHTHLIWGS